MAKYDVIVNFDTLAKINKNVDDYGNQLVQVLEKCKQMMIDLEAYYNTPNGKLINDVIKEYITNREEYIKNHYYPVKNIVRTINDEYYRFYSDVQTLIK